ncbi:MAG: class I SAM-dependent methyltransferase [Alphaproteobacteria bacterium]|nr:class I SAM-dependent methyltransferase [Alphaproteobacteria bacterium]
MSNKSPNKFFYAHSDADYYDETIELTVPYYQIIFKTMLEVLEYHFKDKYGTTYKETQGVLLDIGAGTGKESLAVLKYFSNLSAIALDISPNMKAIYDQNYKKLFRKKMTQRYSYLIKDILSFDKNDQDYIDCLKIHGQLDCQVVISAYCIHHFNLAQKKEIYQKIYDCLCPGGLMINIDLSNYYSESIKLQAHFNDIEYINREFDNPSSQFKKAKKLTSNLRENLKHKWLHHMENDNILDSVEDQLKILNDIGFINTECVFKYWQQSILIAKKHNKIIL